MFKNIVEPQTNGHLAKTATFLVPVYSPYILSYFNLSIMALHICRRWQEPWTCVLTSKIISQQWAVNDWWTVYTKPNFFAVKSHQDLHSVSVKVLFYRYVLTVSCAIYMLDSLGAIFSLATQRSSPQERREECCVTRLKNDCEGNYLYV